MGRQLGWMIPIMLVVFAFTVVPQQPTLAATLSVGNRNALVSAINNANNETSHPGPDTILLTGDIKLTTAADNDPDYGPSGLPPILTDITIEGQGHTIARIGGTNFRIFRIANG